MRLVKILLLSILLLAIFGSSFAQNASTVNVSGTSSTQNITNNVATVVDPLLVISSDGDIAGFTAMITGSYASGDILDYTGSLPSGVSAAAFNTTSRSLQFSGTTSAANWQALLRTVRLKTTSATCYQEQRQVSFIAGLKFYNNLNGHFYEVSSGTSTWQSGFSNAATQSYFGRLGYMATLTSQAENSFVSKILAADSWIGATDDYSYINTALGTTTYASQSASEGKWYWASGPEKGTQMSTANQVNISGVYNSWNGGEPNNSGGENFAEIYVASGNWNDLNGSQGYKTIIEYGGMSTDNTTANVVFTRNLMITGAPSGTITGGNATVCTGSNSTTMTLSGLASGGSVVKWQYSYDDFLTNGVDIASSASTSYTATNITQNTYYRAVVNTTGCSGLTTSSTRITVNAAVPGNIVADNNTICNGASVNFTLNGYSGSVVKWQVSTSSTFANSITDIANTTAAMSYQLNSAGTYYFRAVVLSCSNTVYTNIYTVNAIAGSAPVGGTVSSVSYCGGSNSGSLTLSGSTGNVSKWQYSTDGGIVWTDVTNTTTTLTYSAITATRQYRAVLTNGSCGTALSAAGTITVNPASVAGTASGTASVCASTNSTNLSLSGNTGTIQWQSSTNNSTFTDIAGEVAATYVATNLSTTTYYRAVISSAACAPATSGTVTITVKQPSTSTTNASICAGSSYSFAGSSYTATGTYVVHLNNAVGCDSAATLNLTVNALPPTPTITPSGATTFCAGGSVTLTADAASSYLWNNSATTQSILVTTTGNYTVTISDGTCTAISAPVTVTVNSSPVVAVITQAGQFGNGLALNGSSNYAITPNIINTMPTTDMTVEVWFKANAAGVIIDELGQGSLNGGWHDSQIEILSTGEVKVRVWSLNPVSIGTVTFGTWNHAVVRYSASASRLDGLLNGVASSSFTTGSRSRTSAQYYAFGGTDGTNMGSGAYFNGTIDEIRIWKLARTNAQIQAAMNTELAGTETGLVAYYNFNQGIASGSNAGINTIIDKTSNNFTGSLAGSFTLSGSTSNWVAGAVSSSVILGNVCVGSTIQLSNATTGGVWASSNTAVATVSNTGLVTGVTNGTAVVSYAVTNANGCTTTVTTNITVNNNPVVAAITGNTSVCVGSTTALANTTTGGVWSAASTSIATVNASGVVTGVSNGTSSIYYAVTNPSGCATTVNTTVTVNALPSVNGIGQSGELGNGLALNSGAANYVSVSSNTNIPVTTGAYTIESYIKPNAHGVNGIVGWGNWGTTNQVNALRLGTGNTIVNYWWSNDLIVTLPNSLADGLWHHIAATYDGTTRKIYVDGVLRGQDNPTGHTVTVTSNLRIGTTNNSEYFNGNLDEVRIWNIARTQAQIQASMAIELAGTESGLVAYYNFNQGVAGGNNAGITTLLDKTSNANNGILQNIALTGTTSNFVSGANGNGASNNVCVGNTIELTNTTTGGVWSSLNTSIATVNANGIVAGVSAGNATINYTVTNSNGCTTTVSRSITVNVLPVATITASGSTTLCLGSSVTLTASIGTSYLWSNGETTRTITVSTAGSYNVVVTNASGCSVTSANTTVIVNNPSASTTVIKVPFGATYTFNGVTYTATGIYVAHLTNALGCDSTATLDFTVDPKPSAGADQTVLCGSATKTVTLTGTLPTTGAWSSMASNYVGAILGTTVNGVVEVTLPVAPFTGKLSYVYTTFGGKDTVDIYVNGPTSPVIEIHTGSPVLCTGATVQLCPLLWGFSNYQWYKDGYALASPVGVSSCITIDATGIGSYTLAGTNGSDCWSQPSAPQIVSSVSSLTKPTITVTGSTALCNGGSTTLTSSSASGNLWFKNGNSTGVTSQSYTVSDAADYSVLVSSGTCTSTMSLAQTITNGVKASFTTANATNNCDSTISFTSTSAGTSSTWNFGDGGTGIGNTVTHKYATTGSFTVQQAVISVGGCKDTSTQSITVASCPPPPAPTTCNITPGFNIISNTVNGGSYTYISTSTITNGNMTYFWDFGNGTNSTLISPSITYTSAGTYQVKLVVTGNLGCKDSITQSVVVTITAPPVTPPVCTAPVADFTIANATQCLTSNAFSFSNTSTGTSPTYTWNFGDGSASVTTTAAAHSYTAANTYTVTLVATNVCGSNQVTKTVTVTTAPATPASISGATSITAGTTTTLSSATTGGVWFSNNTTVATVDANGIVSALTAGTATISYTVTNSCGSSTTSLSITVTAAIPPVTPPTPPICTAPVADFTIANATQCLVANAFSFSNASTGTSPTYTWNFGDGSASVTTTAAAHSYTAANTYTVTLVATNACGSNQITKTVTIQNVPPAPASISGATSLTVGTTTTLSSATASGVWTSNNSTVATVAANGVVTALAAGTATISYTVSNSCGTASTSINITVTAAVVVPPPVVVPPTPAPCNLNASFTINNVSQCVVGNQYVFTNTTTGGTAPFTYLWDLNDGTTAATKDVTKVYAAYGDHDVTLKVTDANGCVSNAAAQQLYVGAKPKANFTVLTYTGSGQSTTFISSSTITSGTMSYLWDLGNGSTSTLVNPTTNYTPGTYTIQLIVSGIGTCKDTAIQSITELAVASVKVYPNPVMDIIQVSFVSASATPTTFKLMDLAGRVLQIQTVTPSSRGANVLATMNTRGLQSGTYVLYISDEQNGFLATKAILKQ